MAVAELWSVVESADAADGDVAPDVQPLLEDVSHLRKRKRENHKAKYNCIVGISFEGNESWKENGKIDQCREGRRRIRIRYLNLKENHVKDRSKRVYLTGISNKQRPKKSYKIVREIRKALKPYFCFLQSS